MPIPTSDLQKQVKAPNAVEGKAVNFTEIAAQQLKTMNDNIMQAGNLLSTGIQWVAREGENARRRASDDAAKQAFNDYEVAKDDLNTQLQSLEGQDAVDFYYGDYTKNINKAHQQLVATLDSLPDKDIAEAYRNKVNDINQKNRGFSYLSAKRQENAVREADHKAFLQNVSMEHVNDLVTAPRGVNRYEYAAANAYRDIDEANAEYLASRGLNTEAIRKAANQEVMTKFAGEMLRNVANSADWDGAQTGQVYQNEILPAVKAMQKYVDKGTYQQLLEHYAGEAIRTDALLRPNDFINPETGQIDKNFLNKNYYGLTPWQKTQILTSIQTSLSKSGNASLTSGEAKDRKDIIDAKVERFRAMLADIGLSTSSDYKILQLQQNLSKDDVVALRKNAIKNFKLDKALDTIVEMNELLENGNTLPNGKTISMEDDRLRSMLNDLKQYVTLYTQNYSDELTRRQGFFGTITDYLIGTNPTVKQAVLHDLIRSQKEREGYSGTQVEALDLREALINTAKQMSLDPSVNWNASADSREGFRNPAVLDKVKIMASNALAGPGGQVDVFRNISTENLAALNTGRVTRNPYEDARNQFAKRLDARFNPPTFWWEDMARKKREFLETATPVQRFMYENSIQQRVSNLFNNMIDQKLKLEEQEQQEIDNFNGENK